MTHRANKSEPTTLNTQPRSWKRYVLRGLIISATIFGLGCVAVAAPLASPPTVLAPATKGLHLGVTETARAAYIQKMLNDGYEILPPITLNEVNDA